MCDVTNLGPVSSAGVGIRDYLGRLGGALMSLGAGGALAYLITSHAVGQPSAPLTWPAWPYWLCGGMFLVGALILAAVQGWIGWLYRRLRVAAPAAPSVPLAMPSATYDVIKLELVDARWTLWQRAGWLTDIQVRITNTAPGRVIELTSFELESDPGASWDERPRLPQEQVKALFLEMMKRGKAYGPAHLHQMDLQPGDSRLGWFASHAYLPYPARKGKPYCEFTVTDDEGETYTLPIPGQGPHACAPPHGLLRLRNRATEGLRMRERLSADGSEPDATELRRFEGWTVKVADALESQPDYLAQFQRTLPSATVPDSAEIEHSTETLEEIVRTLEGRMVS